MKKLLFLFISIVIISCNSSKKSNENKIKIGASMLSMQKEFIVNIADEMQKKADELGVEQFRRPIDPGFRWQLDLVNCRLQVQFFRPQPDLNEMP